MRRGTTPTITFRLPFSADGATKLSIAFAQYEDIVIEKDIDDCTINGQSISVLLTEEETLKLDWRKNGVDMQIRIELDGQKMASNIMHTTVDRILKEGIL